MPTRRNDQTLSVILSAIATICFAASVLLDSGWRFVPLALGLVLLVAAVALLQRSRGAGDGTPGGWLPSRGSRWGPRPSSGAGPDDTP